MAESTSRLLQTPDLLDGAGGRAGWPTPFELTYGVVCGYVCVQLSLCKLNEYKPRLCCIEPCSCAGGCAGSKENKN